MNRTIFLLAVLVALNGCASSSRTASTTVRTSSQMAQSSTALDQRETRAMDQANQGAAAIDQGSAVLGEQGGAEKVDQASIELRREELVVGKRDVSNGGVLLRTIVETNTVNQPVELRREEYVIERIPASQIKDQEALGRATADAFEGREIFIPLRREEAVASKRALLMEQVRLAKRVETERVTVTRPVRSEDVEIVKMAAPPPGNAGMIRESSITAPAGVQTIPPDQALSLAREELIVGKREVENGGVRLRKVVHTQESSQPVELQREEYTIDRAPLDNRIAENADFVPREIRATLMRQEPVVGVRDFVTEVIRVRKVVETDNQVVSANLRQERLEVINNPAGAGTAMGSASDASLSGATSMSESGIAPRTGADGPAISSDDLSINEQVQAILADRTWMSSPPPWQVDETYVRRGIDVRPPRNVPPSQLPPVSDLNDNNSMIQVTTQNGVVTLRGVAASEAEKRMIGERVAAIPGVRSVNNELEITPQRPPASRGLGASTLNDGSF